MRAAVAIVVLVACGGGDGDELPATDGGVDAMAVDARMTIDAPIDVPIAPVMRTGGVIALAERHAFCTALASCGALAYDECREAVDDTATVQFAIAGCAADAQLATAMGCMKNGTCATCDARLNAWASSYASPACESDTYSVGTGDRFPFYASDSTCENGIRASGGWCTHACSTSAQCAGTGPNGLNHFGTANVCAHDSLPAGFGCYPTCTSTKDCQAWFDETRYGLRIACKVFDDGSAPADTGICVRVSDDRGVELP